VMQASANIRYLESLLGYTEIRSPIDGQITARYTEPGQMVAPGDKKPALIVTNNSKVYLDAIVPQSEVRGLDSGKKVDVIVDSLGEKIFPGKIETLLQSADPQSRAFRIKVIVPNTGEVLKNGMSARGKCISATLRGIVVPRHWLKTLEGEFYVVQVEHKDNEDHAIHRKVETSLYDEDRALISKGLEEGMTVISTGQETLKDGDLLSISEDNGNGNHKANSNGTIKAQGENPAAPVKSTASTSGRSGADDAQGDHER
jgi:RND family efflux transporter MFP subunit